MTCLFLIRDFDTVDSLQKELVTFVKSKDFGVNFHPVDVLLTERQISLSAVDFVYSLCDSFEYIDSYDCVLYPEGAPYNGREHRLSFTERMMTIQQAAEIALKYTDEVELFVSDDGAYLPEFAVFELPCQHVAETLSLQYCGCELPYAIPSVHMKIHK